MTPNLNCEEAQGLTVPVHQGSRVLPTEHPPAKAWHINELGQSGDKTLIYNSSAASFTSTYALCNRSTYTPLPSNDKPQVKSRLKIICAKLSSKLDFIKLPYFMLSMVLVLVCVHLFVPSHFKSHLEWSPKLWWREPWRLITYGCIHASATHLALNAVIAIAAAWRLECEQQRRRVVCVWVGGVVAGALGAGVLQPHVRVVGASAAVYALLTAHLPNVCLRYGKIPLWWFRPLSVLVLWASETCWALFGTPALTPAAPHHRHHYEHVAWSAHILGAAVGIPLAFILFEGEPENEEKTYNRVCRIISPIVLVAGVIFSIIYLPLS